MNLKKLKEAFGKEVFGKSPMQAIRTGLCVNCNKPALERCYSFAGRKEYFISGLCEICFDKITAPKEADLSEEEATL